MKAINQFRKIKTKIRKADIKQQRKVKLLLQNKF